MARGLGAGAAGTDATDTQGTRFSTTTHRMAPRRSASLSAKKKRRSPPPKSDWLNCRPEEVFSGMWILPARLVGNEITVAESDLVRFDLLQLLCKRQSFRCELVHKQIVIDFKSCR